MWLYNGNEFKSENIENYIGFVYCITNNLTGKKYIGKKIFKTTRMLPPLKGKKRRRKVIKESNWKEYWGSSKYLNADIKKYGESNFSRKILSLHENKTEVNYSELVTQIKLNVLDSVDSNGNRKFYNENIARIFYPSEKFRKIRTNLIDSEIIL